MYDCFDLSLFNNISISPLEWMQGFVRNRNVKIVLVATELGCKRQDALIHRKEVKLNDPHVFDPLFTCALKTIMEHVVKGNEYSRIYVVR